ncbi:unnamed protein product [Rangifer tarandus platyrhynchus]|uniref:Uncharacterized protein n=1 Tax=Rangifer tarandus platyrhynchus TaxID=3082113 RepID=A0AC59YEF2_RANTA
MCRLSPEGGVGPNPEERIPSKGTARLVGARDQEDSRELGESQTHGGRKRGRKDSGGVSFPTMSGSVTKRQWSSPGNRAPPRA